MTAPPSDAAVAQAAAWHRQVAALVEAADRAGVATTELGALRSRLAGQAARLNQTATARGAALPALVPTPSEIATAGSALGDLSAAAVAAAVRSIEATLADVDVALNPLPVPKPPAAVPPPVPVAPPPPPVSAHPATPTPAPAEQPPSIWDQPIGGPLGPVKQKVQRSVHLRNAAIYGAFSAVVLIVEVWLYVLFTATQLPILAPFCLLFLPALAFGGAWLMLGVLFRPPDKGKLNRTPRLGVVICLLPNILLILLTFVLVFIGAIGD